jgi:hypothetical protein
VFGYGYFRSAFRNIRRACPVPGRHTRESPSGPPVRILPFRLRSGRSRLSKMLASERRSTSAAALLLAFLIAGGILFAIFYFVRI